DANPSWPTTVIQVANSLAARLVATGLTVKGSGAIRSVATGQDLDTFSAWQTLLDKNVYVNAVVPPAVAQGTGALRLSVTVNHTDDDILETKQAFAAIRHLLQ